MDAMNVNEFWVNKLVRRRLWCYFAQKHRTFLASENIFSQFVHHWSSLSTKATTVIAMATPKHDTSYSTGPIKVHDQKAFSMTSDILLLNYRCVCMCAAMCTCWLPSGSSSLSIPRCCSALLKACSSLSIADVFFSTELQSKSSGLRRQRGNQ